MRAAVADAAQGFFQWREVETARDDGGIARGQILDDLDTPPCPVDRKPSRDRWGTAEGVADGAGEAFRGELRFREQSGNAEPLEPLRPETLFDLLALLERNENGRRSGPEQIDDGVVARLTHGHGGPRQEGSEVGPDPLDEDVRGRAVGETAKGFLGYAAADEKTPGLIRNFVRRFHGGPVEWQARIARAAGHDDAAALPRRNASRALVHVPGQTEEGTDPIVDRP